MKSLTEEELVQTLVRSALPTVIIEGKDDAVIYRWMEEEEGVGRLNFLSCGGRDMVLKLYDRRSEFSHIKTAFVADLDAYLYTGVPIEYSDIVWTNGYSIENDLYYGRGIESMLNANERIAFCTSINNFIKYYGFEFENCINENECCFRYHPNQILDDNHALEVGFLTKVGYINPNAGTVNHILSSYDTMIRGKTLFALILRHLSGSDRSIKYSKWNLLEICFRVYRSVMIDDIRNRIMLKMA
ncbi:DUF4435 domain-containing protein [Hymenobacter metallilatus]|uniref:DUF4435 domain-containing protein n=1 Tax=Hymenobacter metallilatus TaxID=2493666 RepID=A0A428JSV8_9BACT|nr:DUF4435 domain-containing protein [Hymenobacter metallilatus]RSK37218.1 DUF4435 domain-containing protein [Hymenobacter metallilatus]